MGASHQRTLNSPNTTTTEKTNTKANSNLSLGEGGIPPQRIGLPPKGPRWDPPTQEHNFEAPHCGRFLGETSAAHIAPLCTARRLFIAIFLRIFGQSYGVVGPLLQLMK